MITGEEPGEVANRQLEVIEDRIECMPFYNSSEMLN